MVEIGKYDYLIYFLKEHNFQDGPFLLKNFPLIIIFYYENIISH